jgi:primosomal protein N' (replication factor Y)
LPVPLDTTFIYRVDRVCSSKDGGKSACGNGPEPVVGGRVLVPFREKRLSGVVVAIHDRAPNTTAKLVLRVLDTSPLLDETLLKLGRWIAQYYIAPLGEVLRTMLPLSAEWKRAQGYRITVAGLELVRHPPLDQLTGSGSADTETAVLEHLAQRPGSVVREATLRAATGAGKDLLNALLRKKLISREDLSDTRDASRTVKFAVLKEESRADSAESAQDTTGTKEAKEAEQGQKKARPLNANQQRILDQLKSAGGRMRVEAVRELPVPRGTLATLVRRELVAIVEEPAEFVVSRARVRPALAFIMTPAQKTALLHINTAVEARRFSVSLVHGVTGSGKTAVYLAAMQKVLAEGRGAIMLVPEIGLTPAAAAQLHQAFGDEVAILHSGLSDAERAEQWHRIRRGEARIVAGTRSAVFAPVHDLALIVVDEEHDHSYKQEETPRYHARDVAVVRAKMCGAAVVLGSATPSLESYFNAQRGKYALIELPDRVEKRPLPEVELVDMKQEYQETGRQHVISRRLGEEIAARLARGEQAMILLNRRGFSAFVMCRACGETVQCRHCAVAMTYHKRSHKLECHYCGYQQKAPEACPKCGSDYVQFLGTGSEKLEELLHAQFPQARIGRLDRDTVRSRYDFENMLNAMNAGEIDLLVGTQMIAKGHDIHGVTLVGVVGADAALAFPDFRAAERTFQLLTQVAGRAGRGAFPGKVILQTHFLNHYAVQFAAHHDFSGFYDKELRYRSWMHYPPFNALANVMLRSERLEEALKYAGVLGSWFRDTRHEGVRVLGPAAAPIVRLKNEYRYHLLLKSGSREKLNQTLRAMLAYAAAQKIPRVNVMVDVDAMSLL